MFDQIEEIFEDHLRDFYTEIGRTVVAAAALDNTLDLFVGSLLGQFRSAAPELQEGEFRVVTSATQESVKRFFGIKGSMRCRGDKTLPPACDAVVTEDSSIVRRRPRAMPGEAC